PASSVCRPDRLGHGGACRRRGCVDGPELKRVQTRPQSLSNGDLMKPRLSVITLGVDDLERSLKFYRDGLGLPTEGIIGAQFEHGAVAFFDLQAGLKLAIWPRESLSNDSGIPLSS